MHTTTSRLALAAASMALILATAACGGGGDDAPIEASANALDADRATAQARRRPPPPAPAPPPATDATLALASATAAGAATDGNVCAVSGNGGKVLFTSFSSTLVSSDPTPFLADMYLKDFNGNGVTRVVTNLSRQLNCLAMTPDANTVVFVNSAINGQIDVFGNSGSELAILALNLTTGVQARVTPLLSSLANVDRFQFAGVSDDGLRVAFIAQPTVSCNIFDCTAIGPARMFVRDLASGALINLESQVRFTTAQGVADGAALLSPNGRTLAFSSRAAYPEASSPEGGVFALDVASRNVRPINTDAAGRQVALGEARAFLSNSSQVAFFNTTDTNAGPAGVYVKDLATGALNRMPVNPAVPPSNTPVLSFSDDGRKVAFVEGSGGGQTYRELPRVVDLLTGARLNAATLTNGTVGNGLTNTNVLLSRDGKVTAFSNNSTNLLGGVSPLGGAELRAYRKLLP